MLKFSLNQSQGSVTVFLDKSENRVLSLRISPQKPRHLTILFIALINSTLNHTHKNV